MYTWVYHSSITIARLVFAGLYDRHPALKLIAHHGGVFIPHCSGRVEMMPRFTGLDATLGEALAPLRKHPVDYFKLRYVDTAMCDSRQGVACVVDFFGPDRVLFGTDTPLDIQGGAQRVLGIAR